MACPICGADDCRTHLGDSGGIRITREGEATMWHNDTGKPIYVNADRSKVVDEGSPDAAFQLVGPAGTLDDAEAKRLGLDGGDPPEEMSEVEKRRAALEKSMARGATEEARVHRARLADLEAEEAAAKQAEKAQKPAENKAVQSAPENKATK